MIEIDGAHGEGGGQIVRSSLALAMVTGKSVTIENLRARRKKPGLARQHLTAVLAAREICAGSMRGAELGSRRLEFYPGDVTPGEFTFDIGTAGSTSLVLQTVLPPLMIAETPSQLTLRGGTHNSMAPPFEFMTKVYLPLLERMGPKFDCRLIRHGFYPTGGGEICLCVQPQPQLKSLELLKRGQLLRKQATTIISNLPLHIAEREISTLRSKLGWKKNCFHTEIVKAAGPGNVVMATIDFEHVRELFVGFGQRGVSAERVACGVAKQVLAYLKHDAPVGEHLADQILLPLGIAAGQGRAGRFCTAELSGHTLTHIDVLKRFLDVTVEVIPKNESLHTIEIINRALNQQSLK